MTIILSNGRNEITREITPVSDITSGYVSKDAPVRLEIIGNLGEGGGGGLGYCQIRFRVLSIGFS